MKGDYQKPFKKLALFFLSNPVYFNRQCYQKQKGPATSAQSLFRLRNKFTKTSLLVYIIWPSSYILSDPVWWFNIKRFLSYSKNYTCKFMEANSWHHKLFHFHLSFWIWKVWKGREKITKIWISREREELFRWNKKHFFAVFEGFSFGEEIKIW